MSKTISNRDKRLVGAAAIIIFALGMVYFVSRILPFLIIAGLVVAGIYFGRKFLSKKA